MKLNKSFGERLAYLRKVRNLTQASLAEDVGVTVQHIGNIERGISWPSAGIVEAICGALEIDPASLFLFSRSPKQAQSDANEAKEQRGYERAPLTFPKIGILRLEIGAGIWRASDSFFQLLGTVDNKISPIKLLLRLVHEDHLENLSMALEQALNGQAKPKLAFDIRRKDGTIRYMVSFWDYFHNDGGEPVELFVSFIDITEWCSLHLSLLSNRHQLESHVKERTRELHKVIEELRSEVSKRKQAQDLVSKNEKWYRQILDTAQTAITLTGPDGSIEYLNKTGLKMFDLDSIESAKEIKASSFWHDNKERNSLIDKLKNKGFASNIEARLKNLKGDILTVLGSSVLTKTPEGKDIIVNSFLDITDRKAIDEALLLKDKAINESISAMTMSDMDGKLTYVNKSFLEMWGYADENEVLGSRIVDFWYDKSEPKKIIDELNLNKHAEAEMKAVRKDGSALFVHLSANLVCNESNEPIARMASFVDITPLKDVQNKLEQKSQMLENLVNNLPGIAYQFAIDANGKYSFPYMSKRGLEILGHDLNELVADSNIVFSKVPSADRKSVEDAIAVSARQMTSYEIDHRIVKDDGQIMWMHVKSTPTILPDGSILWDGIGLDITKRKQLELELKDSEARFRTIFEKSPYAIGITELGSGRIIDVNETLCSIIGKNKSQIIGKSTTELKFYSDEDRKRFVDNLIEHGCVSGLEMDFSSDRGRHVAKMYANFITLNDEKYVLTTFEDITAQRSLENKLTNEKLKYNQLYKSLNDIDESIWALFNNSDDLIFIKDKKSRYIMVNPAMGHVFGMDPKEVVGLSAQDIYHQQEIATVDQEDNMVLQGQTIQFERTRTIGNNKYAFHVKKSPIHGPDGQVVGIFGVSRDITERKQIEEGLRRSQTMLARTEAITHTGSWVWEIDTDHVIWSDELFRIFKMEPGGKAPTWAEHESLYHPDDMALLSEAVQRAVDDGYPFERELRAFCKDGETRFCMASGFAEKDGDGRIRRLYGSLQDITERKEAEATLKGAHAILSTAMDCSTAGIAIADAPSGKLRYVNKAALGIRAGDPEEVFYGVGTDRYVESWQIFHFDGTPYEEDEVPLTRAVKYGETCDRQFIIKRPDQEDRVVWASAAPVFNDDGEVIAGIVVFPDITDLMRAEREKEALADQLRQAQKMEAVGTLAGGIAHDFNNILAAITGNTELALEDALEGKTAPEELEAILNASERAKDLVKRILEFSRKAGFESKPLDIHKLITDTVSFLNRTIPKMISVKTNLSADLHIIEGDRAQIEQVFLNLASNASDAMPDGGELLIETSNKYLDEAFVKKNPGAHEGDFVQVTISDTGSGMSEETIERIFEPFFTTKEIGRGTGLGLASAYGILKSHGGYISCESKVGKGSTFKVYMPIIQTVSDAVAESKDEMDQLPSGTETILLVEDEESLRGITSRILQRHRYNVMTASTGEEAIDIVWQFGRQIDLIIMDIIMPGMGGKKALKEILTMEPDLKVCVASGYIPDNGFEEVMQEGAVGLIRKPFSRSELLLEVRRILDEA